MCKLIEELNKEVRIETAKAMLAKGKLSYDDIAEYSGLTIEEVKELAEGKSA